MLPTPTLPPCCACCPSATYLPGACQPYASFLPHPPIPTISRRRTALPLPLVIPSLQDSHRHRCHDRPIIGVRTRPSPRSYHRSRMDTAAALATPLLEDGRYCRPGRTIAPGAHPPAVTWGNASVRGLARTPQYLSGIAYPPNHRANSGRICLLPRRLCRCPALQRRCHGCRDCPSHPRTERWRSASGNEEGGAI